MRFKSVFKLWLGALLVLRLMPAVFAAQISVPPGDQPCAALQNTTILIIRHAEKPEEGPELTPVGSLRAKAYVGYFAGFKIDGQPLALDHIFCTADSEGSHRPRLTVMPLSQALKLPFDNRFRTKNPAALTGEIRNKTHGKAILICWHHGEIPAVLTGLGANPAAVLPGGKWPDEVFGWLIELRYDELGRLRTAQCVQEHLMPDDQAATAAGN
jgi:hypothetical protein